MKLTVLGKYGPFPAPGGACSGYLVECGRVHFILDLGNGALSNLLKILPKLNVDAILLSHLHSDHMSDLLVLRYALQQYSIRGDPVPLPMTVVSPDAPEDVFRTLAGSGVYNIHTAYDGLRLRFSDVTLTLHRTVHPVPTYAYDIEHGGRRLFYTADTGMFQGLAEKCAGADLLLADACFLKPERSGLIASHLTAAEAGQLAREAGVKRLLLTHIWGGIEDESPVLKQARAHFPDSEIAVEMRSYLV